MEELINYLKIWYKNAIDNNDDMNAKSWGYEEGILITANEAKLIIDEWEAKLSDENSGLHKHVVIKSACPDCMGETDENNRCYCYEPDRKKK